jgi:hypothetical protein
MCAHEFVSKPWAQAIPSDVQPHHQYQLGLGEVGLEEVGLELKSFESSWQLVNVMADALQGEVTS